MRRGFSGDQAFFLFHCFFLPCIFLDFFLFFCVGGFLVTPLNSRRQPDIHRLLPLQIFTLTSAYLIQHKIRILAKKTKIQFLASSIAILQYCNIAILISPKFSNMGPRIVGAGTLNLRLGPSGRKFEIYLFSCPEQLNRWPCPLVPCWSDTTNNQSLHNTTEWT